MLIEFECPHCNITLQVSAEFAGTTSTCANCGKEITIPKRNEQETPVSEKDKEQAPQNTQDKNIETEQ